MTRCRLAIEHHACYSHREVDDDRLFNFVLDLCVIPIDGLEASLRLARQTHDGDWAPPSGAVVEAGRGLYNTQGRNPPWHYQMKRGRLPIFGDPEPTFEE